MRRGVTMAVVLAAFSAAFAGPAAAQPACGETITEDTTLEADLICDTVAGDPALVIGAPGITLDLGGHRLSTWSTVIVNHGHDDVTIRNGTVYGEGYNIWLDGVRRNVVEDVRLEGLVVGLAVQNSDRNRISSNDLHSVGIGLGAGSDHNIIEGNKVTGYEGYINIGGSSHNRIVDNELSGPEGSMVSLGQAHHNRLEGNRVHIDGGGPGIFLHRSHDNVVVDNFASFDPAVEISTGGGLSLSESDRNAVRRNTFAGATPGVALLSGADNVLRANLAAWSLSDGFFVAAPATGTLLQNNDAIAGDDDGFDVEAPGTVLRRNTANGNGDLGIEAVPGVTDGGGNQANGNENPLQCVNVFCS
jgi:hypothetical protein